MREYVVENEFVKAVKAAGGVAYKLTSQTANGLPDRLVLFFPAKTVFVELKAPGKMMRPLQRKRRYQLMKLGFPVLCIPFTRHFEDHEQDKTLKTTLMQPENLSGILNWCIEGYRLYKAEGLDEPEEVKAATEEYRVESDRIAQFMRQCLKKEKGSEIKAANVYSRYKDWCRDNGYKYEGSQHFYARLGMEYTIVKRRPWKADTTGNTNAAILVNDIAWVLGEEPETDLVPLGDDD